MVHKHLLAFGLVLGFLSAANADLIIDLPEPATNASVISATQYNAVSFSLTAGFSNVSIDASLTASTAGTTGTAFLTTVVGPAATPADVLASTQFQFAVAGGTQVSFVNLFNGTLLCLGRHSRRRHLDRLSSPTPHRT
jgi:hypothetical protein